MYDDAIIPSRRGWIRKENKDDSDSVGHRWSGFHRKSFS